MNNSQNTIVTTRVLSTMNEVFMQSGIGGNTWSIHTVSQRETDAGANDESDQSARVRAFPFRSNGFSTLALYGCYGFFPDQTDKRSIEIRSLPMRRFGVLRYDWNNKTTRIRLKSLLKFTRQLQYRQLNICIYIYIYIHIFFFTSPPSPNKSCDILMDVRVLNIHVKYLLNFNSYAWQVWQETRLFKVHQKVCNAVQYSFELPTAIT